MLEWVGALFLCRRFVETIRTNILHMQGQRFVDLVISCTNDGRVYLAAATDTSSFLVWDLETRRYHGTIIPSETKKRFRDRSGGKQACTCVAASLGQSASLLFFGKQNTNTVQVGGLAALNHTDLTPLLNV